MPQQDRIAELEAIFGFSFSQPQLYILALTHPSFANEKGKKGKSGQQDNERLELLGDSVLGLCITEYLYQSFPQRNEGQLSKLRSYIVSAESLAQAAREHGLGRFILLGKGESQNGGQQKDSLLANVVEALIGACYLEQGLDGARKLVLFLLTGQLERHQNRSYSPQDAKLRLQEYVQSRYKNLPQYQTTELFSPEGRQSRGFKAELYINQEYVCSGEGSSKKQAEKHAARLALEGIREAGE